MVEAIQTPGVVIIQRGVILILEVVIILEVVDDLMMERIYLIHLRG
jgi:hypothetical protein